jgi:hypothetical protein
METNITTGEKEECQRLTVSPVPVSSYNRIFSVMRRGAGMAENTSNTSLASLTRLKQEAAKATAALQKDIAEREAELSALRAELERWQAALSDGTAVKRGTREARKRTREQRLDWSRVLAALPSAFTSQDVRRETGKPMAQVYSGLARWRKEKRVRQAPGGGYRKVSAGAQPGQRAMKKVAQAQQVKANG